MASIFDEIDAAGQAAINDHLGEAVIFYGMKSSDYAEAADPDREPQEVKAIYSASPGAGRVSEGVKGKSQSAATRSHSNDELWISAATAAAMAWIPQRNDEVVINPETEAKRLVISAVNPIDNGDYQVLASRRG